MSVDLARIFAGLVRHHVATVGQPLPPATPGITWIWAANGIFKRGVNESLDLLIQVERFIAPLPGLIALLPSAAWRAWPQRLPSRLLTPLLADAQRAGSAGLIARPIEKQYFIVWRDADMRLIAPRGQEASAARVAYAMPSTGVVLCDLHSHHEMPAFFSATDDADDTASGLSVSAVIGRLFTRPEIAVRLNVYGAHMRVPAQLVFDDVGPFADTFGGDHADTGD